MNSLSPVVVAGYLTVCMVWNRYIHMKTRVSITLDPEIHRLAKKSASRKRTSVSGLIESLLQFEVGAKKSGSAARLVGSAELRSPAPGHDPLRDALSAKYLRG